MPITKIIDSLASTCRYCGRKAGVFQRDHQDCQETHQAGWQEMVQLAAQAASAHTFNEAALRQILQAIAQRSRATGEDIDRALEEGFRQGVAQAMSDGIITRDEEERLRAFRDRLALESSSADQGVLAELDRSGADRVVMEARLAAISVQDGDGYLQDLALTIRQAWTKVKPTGSSSRLGKRPSRGPWRTVFSPWTRRMPWPSTQVTSP